MKTTNNVKEVIAYIEAHLYDKLDLNEIAEAMHYSKFYLHRCFRKEVGITIHEYVQRRKINEAAKLLVCSSQSILAIALFSGFESQQSFSACFKELYKKSPLQYRQAASFYPLQLPYTLHEQKANALTADMIRYATSEDITRWMELVDQVIDGFPSLHRQTYITELIHSIEQQRAFILVQHGIAIGIMMFLHAHIEFLGVHPQYRNAGIQALFIDRFLQEFCSTEQISITTFREGDKADTGYRFALEKLGFVEAELLTEFQYPTQRFLLDLRKEREHGSSDESPE